jgi:hypothetical protein
MYVVVVRAPPELGMLVADSSCILPIDRPYHVLKIAFGIRPAVAACKGDPGECYRAAGAFLRLI